jgi:hypothetical protein
MCLFYCGVPLSEAELMIGLFSTIQRSLFKRIFSKTLDTMVKSLIGQYDVNLLGGLASR